MSDNNIIIFDGVCNLCNWSVRFIIPRDSHGMFKFVAAQSEVGQRLLSEHNDNFTTLKSVILLKDGELLEKSTAALEITAALDGAWKYLTILHFVPRPIRDFVYDWIARNRYRWFGEREVCMMPNEEQEQRFL
jgi:predicted DCC family thiol-disulfide oxidoreductase YuxK